MARKKQHFDGFVPEPGFEEQWQRHVDSVARLEKAEHERDKIKVNGSSDKNWLKFLEANRIVERAISTVFSTFDGYAFAVKHKDDKLGVPEDEIRSVVIDSLSDKLEELEFSLNVGLLGSKVAQAIRSDTSEESAGDPPFCQDCN